MNNFTEEECLIWSKNKKINPKTGRYIKEGGPVYKSLEKICQQFRKNKQNEQMGGNRNENTTKLNNTNMNWNEENNRIFQKSKEHLQNILPLFQNGNEIEKIFLKYIQKTIETKNKPLLFFRTLEQMQENEDKFMNDISYHEMAKSSKIRELSLYNCHDGQRKLTLGLLEFISKSLIELKCKTKDLFIIYAGSSGLASAIALDIFPELQMILYDPDLNTINFLPDNVKEKVSIIKNNNKLSTNQLKWSPLMIFTDKAGWFNDNSVRYCKNVLIPSSNRKHVLFVSDIRAETSEKDIAKDMKSQMRWTMMLKCDMYMHKFRLPFFDEENKNDIKNMYEDIQHIYPYLKPKFEVFHKEEKENPLSVLYLDGKMMIQPFGRQRTTELRLIGKPHLTKGYQFKYYNVEKIENQMAIFNNIYRGYATFKHNEFNYNTSFEKLAEFDILLSCIKAKKGIENEKVDILEELKNHYNILNNLLSEIVYEKSNIDMCKYASLMKTLKNKKSYDNIVPQYFKDIFEEGKMKK